MTSETSDPTEHPILTLERARQAACISGDADVIAAFMSDDCVYVHSSAQVETKQQMLDRFRAKTLIYRSLVMSDVRVRAYGDMVLVNGDMHIDVTTDGVTKDVRSRYLQAWRLDGDTWQMVSWHSTPIPKPIP